mmetsp:Transcript_121532/g.227140  ORF Transcript_121532/g.227140 Transcript_121532/m.227140 type:complete len:716 (-) Transcript_121532:35-2182(-)
MSIYAQAYGGTEAAQAQLAALQNLFSLQGQGVAAASAAQPAAVAQGLAPWPQTAAAAGFASTAPSSAAGALPGPDLSHAPTGKGGRIQCSVHGKERSIQSLMDDGNGGMRCAPGQECKCGATSGPLQTCSVHGKQRNLQSMTDDGAGGMRCAPGFECKGTGDGGDRPTIACSVHGKMRSLRSLIDDGQGGMKCAPGQECKGFGAPPELIARSPEDLLSIGTPEHQQLVQRVKTLQRRGEDYRVLWTTWCSKPGEGGKKDPAGRTVEDLRAFLVEADPEGSTIAPVVPPPMWAPGAMKGNMMAGWDMGGMLDGWGMDTGMMGKFGGKFGMMGKGMGMMGKMGLMGKAMAGMMGKTIPTRPMMSMDELVVRVKAVIRSDGGKELWHAFVDTHGGGKRDPANRTADFLQAFLDDADPDYSISDAGMDDPEMQEKQQQLALTASPAAKATDLWSSQSLPLPMAPATGLMPPLGVTPQGPEHAHAIARVKAVIRTEGCEDYWPTWLARMGFTKQDPAAYRFEDLHLFLAEVDPNETTIDVQVDEADMEKDRLVARVKAGQRGSDAFREAWMRYCEENGGGSRDPARHDMDFLSGFLAVAPSDQPPELTEEHMRLVAQVKSLQRTNKDFQEAWWKHCDENGGGKRDPARHEADFLENFLLYWRSTSPEANQYGEEDAYAEKPAPQVVPPAAAWKGKGAWAQPTGAGGMKGGKQQWNRWNPY